MIAGAEHTQPDGVIGILPPGVSRDLRIVLDGVAANGSPNKALARSLLQTLGFTTGNFEPTLEQDGYVQDALVDTAGSIVKEYVPERKKPKEFMAEPTDSIDSNQLSQRATTVLEFLSGRKGMEVTRATLESVLSAGYKLSKTTAAKALATVLKEISLVAPGVVRSDEDKTTGRKTIVYIDPVPETAATDLPRAEVATSPRAPVETKVAEAVIPDATLEGTMVDSGLEEVVKIEELAIDKAPHKTPRTIEDFEKLGFTVIPPTEKDTFHTGLGRPARITQEYLQNHPYAQVRSSDIAEYVHRCYPSISERHVQTVLRRDVGLIANQFGIDSGAALLIREGKTSLQVVYIPTEDSEPSPNNGGTQSFLAQSI